MNPIQSAPIQILSMSILNTTWKQQNNIDAKSTCWFKKGDFFSFSNKPRPHVAFLNRFCPCTQKRDSDYKQYVDGSMRSYWYVTAWRNSFPHPFNNTSTAKRRFQNLHNGESFWKDAFSVIVFTGCLWTGGHTTVKNIRFETKTDTFGRTEPECL